MHYILTYLYQKNFNDIADQTERRDMSKHQSIPAKTRKMVYEKYAHHCAYCGCELEYKDMQVDHVESVYIHNDYHREKTLDELNEVENLMPSCRQCNFYKSSGDIEFLRRRIEDELVRNMRKPFDYRLALKYGLIEEHIEPVRFYFEKIEIKKIILAKCDEREKRGYDNLTDSDVMDILDECRDKGFELTRKELKKLGLR